MNPITHSSDAPNDVQNIYAQALALKRCITDLEKRAFLGVLNAHGATLDNPANGVSSLVALCRSDTVGDFMVAKGLLALVESSDEYKQAATILEPLLKAEAEAAAKLAADTHAARQEIQKHREALAEVTLAATKAIEASPEVVKAKSAIEAATARLAAIAK
jgi:hypothetical protein